MLENESCLVALALCSAIGCTPSATTRRETPSRDAAPAVTAAPTAATTAPSATPAIASEAGAPTEEPLRASVVEEASPSLAVLCQRFLTSARKDGAELAQTFSFRQLPPKCQVGATPAHWSPSGAFLEARAVAVARIAREETRLSLRLARGWVLTPIAWSINETESRTPPWTTLAPESFEISASRVLVYLPGADWAHNDSSPLKPTVRMLRGAFACEDNGTTLTCWEWDPTERASLGTKEAPRGFKAWNDRPWSNEHQLMFGGDAAVGLPPHL